MDAANHVGAYGQGFRVIVNGQIVPGDNPDGTWSQQNQAEQAFNQRVNPTPTIAPQPAPQQNSQFAGLWNSLTNSNQQQFDRQGNQFDQTLGEQRRQFDLTNTNQQQSMLSTLLQGLLGNATQLAGSPANWLDYANYTAGGRNIFDLLKGNQPVPAFQQPGGFTANNSIQNLLAQLGIGQTTSPEAHAMAQVTSPITGTTQPAGSAQQPTSNTPSLMGPPVPNSNPASGGQEPGMFGPPVSGQQPLQQPTAGQNQMASLPYQNNPIVWDSLSPTAQAMILASAQHGNTPSGYWSPEDYISQLNASRPKGNAPSQVMFNYRQPQGLFG